MAWTTPLTAVSNAALTAAQWNASVRDNLNETAPAKATAAGGFFVATGVNTIIQRNPDSATVITAQTTTSTTFVDLATSGPTITAMVSDVRAILWLTAQMNNNTVNGECLGALAVSGATTIVPDDNTSIDTQSATANADNTSSRCARYSLTAGSNTFKLQYRVSTGTGSFRRRTIVGMPF